MKKEVFRCAIRTIAPVHLGCDEVYEPMGFVVDDQKGELVAFDPLSFIANLSPEDKARFSALCKQGNLLSILDLYRFFQGRNAPGRPVALCSDFIAHYRQTLSLPANERVVQQELNRFAIERTAFNLYDNRPVIPGSAVKGAMRTAYLNSRANPGFQYDKKDKGAAKKLENRFLNYGKIEEDPFRLVKVSDFRPAGMVPAKIVYGVNEKKVPSANEARGLYQILEVILPGALFVGEIVVERPLNGAPIKSPIPFQALWESTDQFYRKEKAREEKELERIGAEKLPADNEGIILRIGRHSGAESVTVEGYRDIRIMTGRGKPDRYDDHATTLWLASESRKADLKANLKPFGWASLQHLTPEIEEEYDAAEAAWDRIVRERKDARIRMQQERIEAREAAEARKREAEQAAEEAAQRQAEMEAMSPEERAIAEIRDPKVLENWVVEIYNNLETFAPDRHRDIALALKDYWQEQGKWKKKECTKKQWGKVQAVKRILGE